MEYKFGDIIIDPTNPKCIGMLGKLVLASQSGKMISKNPEHCAMGILKEINVDGLAADKPFIVATKDGIILPYSFIREIIKA